MGCKPVLAITLLREQKLSCGASKVRNFRVGHSAAKSVEFRAPNAENWRLETLDAMLVQS